MSALKVFITREGRATFVCPECERSRTVDVSRNAKLARASRVRVKCPCGYHYPVILERRRFLSGQLNQFSSSVCTCRRVSLRMARDNPAGAARIAR